MTEKPSAGSRRGCRERFQKTVGAGESRASRDVPPIACKRITGGEALQGTDIGGARVPSQGTERRALRGGTATAQGSEASAAEVADVRGARGGHRGGVGRDGTQCAGG